MRNVLYVSWGKLGEVATHIKKIPKNPGQMYMYVPSFSLSKRDQNITNEGCLIYKTVVTDRIIKITLGENFDKNYFQLLQLIK